MIIDVLCNVHTFLCKALCATSCHGHCATEVLCIITEVLWIIIINASTRFILILF